MSFGGKRIPYEPGNAPLPYIKGKKRSLILGSVSACHIGLILVPMMLYSISNLVNPPLSVTKVSLVDSPPNDNPNPSKYPSPDRPEPQGIPEFGNPKPLTDIPDVPDLPPEPEPEPIKKEEPRKEEPKEEPKPAPEPEKPQPKETKVSVPVEKPVAKKETPKTKWKKADEIKVSTKKIIRKSTGTAAANPSRKQGSSNDSRRKDINQILKNWATVGGTGTDASGSSPYGMKGGKGKAGGGGGPVGILDKDLIAYYDKVAAYLKRNWNQPNKAMIGNRMPKVEIRLRVDDGGRVTSAIITSRSGVKVMDSSVEELIAAVKVLPKPPKAMEFIVTMEIDAF